MKREQLDPVSLQIVWNRLISITEEMWTTLWRTAFSAVVAIIQDHGCELMDDEGNCLAHAPSSMPAFNLTMPSVTRAVLRQFPKESMKPGDVFVTNNQWLSAGHLPDICVVTPIFRGSEVVAFAASIAHANDIGGTNDDFRPREVFEEGLWIPVLKLYDAGQRNETLVAMIRSNVRYPDEVMGDLEAQVAANEVGARRLVALLDEYGLSHTRTVAEAIFTRTERAIRHAIEAIPDGTYRGEDQFDGLYGSLHINATVTVKGSEMSVDFAGTSPQVDRGGLNATMAYTAAQTFYSLMCILSPHLPNNEGSLRPLSITAPEGSILNCIFPAPVNLRLRSGWHISPAIYQALAPVLPQEVLAGCGYLGAFQTRGLDGERPFSVPYFAGGGQGGSLGRDGRSGYIFPSTAKGMSVELFEAKTSLMIREKRILADSGGAGQFRGGPGQRVTVALHPDKRGPVHINLTPDRMRCPAVGLEGGQAGSLARVLVSGKAPAPDSTFYTDGFLTLTEPDEVLLFDLPGGGGFGDPAQRDPARIQHDLETGVVTPEGAARDYGYRGEDL